MIITTSAESKIERHSRRHLQRNGIGYILVAPAMVLFIVYTVYSIVDNLVGSIRSENLSGVSHFVGFSNYGTMLRDPIFWEALRNNAEWFVICVGVQLVLGYLLALLLHTNILGYRLFKAIIFSPIALSPVVVSVVWEKLYSPFQGPIAGILSQIFGVHQYPNFLGSPKLALLAVAIVNIWQWTGFSMVILLSGLQNIPHDIIEAAQLDGATYWMLVRRIFTPLIRSGIAILLILGFIGSFQTFVLIYVMTDGGPSNASQVLGTYIFQQAFVNGNFNYGSALSVVLLLIMLIITIIQIRVLRSR